MFQSNVFLRTSSVEVVLLALKAMFDLQDLSPSVKQELATLVQVSE